MSVSTPFLLTFKNVKCASYYKLIYPLFLQGPQARLYEEYVMSEDPEPVRGLEEAIKELVTVETNYATR